MKKVYTLFVLTLLTFSIPFAQQNLVTYGGDSGRDGFLDVLQLSDGTFLVSGYAESLNWIATSVPRTSINLPNVNNGNGTNLYGFILQFSPDFQDILQVVHFPQGAVENVRYLKTTNVPGATTGDLYISGDTEDSKSNNGGYFIAKLNNNFVNGVPTAVDYDLSIWAEGYIKENHPWDVGGDGKVVFVLGQTHAYDWSAMHRLDIDGNRELVPNWQVHWKVGGGEHRGTASSFSGGIAGLEYSGMVFKRGARCCFRSQTATEYNAILPDGNGGTKQGTWPLDAFFDSHCTPGSGPTSGPGYTGYRTGSTSIYGAESIAIDRNTNDIFLGMNIKSVLPDGNPDFEPAVLAFDAIGTLKWWSRLYHEIRPDGTTVNSSPDQYIDGLAIDYVQNHLVVNARCHGNNAENLWEGNTIANNPSANGFQNRFSGTNGNIHISWLGKLQLADGVLNNSSYVAEYVEGSTNYGSAHPDTNLNNWPDPNQGWPNLNTTRLARNNMKVSRDGSVCIVGTGRRTITTANAYQQMPIPSSGLTGTWNEFARVYRNDLSKPLYSTLLTGDWDTSTGIGGGNTDLYGIWKAQNGIVVVGVHKASSGVASGTDIPVDNVPSAWGTNSANNESAILAFFGATNITNTADGPEPVVLPFMAHLEIKVMLQGAYDGSNMNTDIQSILPLTDPYGLGISVSAIPANVVDWVKVEVRDANNTSLVRASSACFLRNDGQVIDLDVSLGVQFNNLTTATGYIVVQHRNHLGIMTNGTVSF
ncbi:MAG: hypothetical protein AAF738_06315 [Bacteroidota bacterium]